MNENELKQINCKINKKEYTLKVLIDKKDKTEGLKKIKIANNEGLLFFNKEDVNFNFDFSNIPFDCILYFLDKDCKIIDKHHVKSFQKNSCIPRKKYRYAIEILDINED